jgi:hypothetical protein
MRTAVLFVFVVAMVATGVWLFVAGLFFESETDIWYVVSGGWRAVSGLEWRKGFTTFDCLRIRYLT